MLPRKLKTFRCRAVSILIACLVLVVLYNYIYFKSLTSSEKVLTSGDVEKWNDETPTKSVAQQIEDDYWAKLSFDWPHMRDQFDAGDTNSRIRLLTPLAAWKLAASWVSRRQVYPENSVEIEQVLKAMTRAPVISTDVGSGGTQLKIMLHLQGGQRAVFKPMRYSRDTIFEDSVYSGADRHNGEVAAFHLSRLLNMRWSPLTVGRRLNVKREIMNVAKKKLRKTFFNKGNSSCFYGVCYYCNVNDAVCSSSGLLEGAVILWLPLTFQLKMFRHPWRRTYKSQVKAPWETDDNYCTKVRRSEMYGGGDRLLDLVDVAVFDFLIGNGDRHRYEAFETFNDSAVLLLDNGKSFGNPDKDEISILAPLYQCCVIRSNTVEKLKSFPARSLSEALRRLLSEDPLHPVLWEPHLTAVDRRRLKVLSVVDYCLENAKFTQVLRQ